MPRSNWKNYREQEKRDKPFSLTPKELSRKTEGYDGTEYTIISRPNADGTYFVGAINVEHGEPYFYAAYIKVPKSEVQEAVQEANRWMSKMGAGGPMSEKSRHRDITKSSIAKELIAVAKMIRSYDLNSLDGQQTKFISQEMGQLLYAQIRNEMFSAYLYYMIAAWCKSKGLDGFDKWFHGQADGEIGHAMKIYTYLIDTGTTVVLDSIPAPTIDFMTMQEVMRYTLDHEMGITQQWQIIGEQAKSEPNLATQQLAQWFMTEQVEEEDITTTLYQRVQLADTGTGLLTIDKELKG